MRFLLVLFLAGVWCARAFGIEVSSFCKAQVPGVYILPAEDGTWTWGMAPIYDEKGKLHIFNSIIPETGSWIRHSKIAHWVADQPEGPYTLVGDLFACDEASYQTNEIYFGHKLARSERPSILWKDGKPECLFLACHDGDPTAGYFVRINNWDGE